MAGRQIKPSKGANDLYDAGRGHVYAEKIQPLPDNMKKKISLILEAIPSKSKSEIAEVLQACDYDVQGALNCFYADGGMESQNEWMVQGKRKNKKKKKHGKKATKDDSDSQSQNDAENCTAAGPTTGKQVAAGQKEVGESIANGTIAKAHPADKPTTSNKDNPKPLENLKPVSNDVPKPSETTPTETTPTPTSPPLLSPLLSPTDSTGSLQDSQTSNKSRGGSSANEKHPRVRTTSGSSSEVIKKSFKDLERSSVSISRHQSKLDEQAESSTKMLAKSFQAIRQALDERESSLRTQLESVIEEAKKLLEERQEDAAGLKFKCNRVGSMSDEETTELRNEIKHFVGERRIDEDLGKTIRFIPDQEKILEAVKNFGEVPPIKHRYTPYKRKHPEPSKPTTTRKPPPVKTTTASSNVSTTTPGTTTPGSTTPATTTSAASETKSTNSSNDKRPVLSPSRLKDQAEIHARLQQAVKEQQVSPVSKEGNKQSDRNASEKPKPRDFGPKSNRNNNGKDQQGNSRREPQRQQPQRQQPQRQRQTNTSQHSAKSFGNRNENKLTNGENSKNQAHADGAKAQDGGPADGVSQAQDSSPADKGVLAQDGSSTENSSQAQQDKPAESNHVTTPNQGNRRTKRRYIRKTPRGDGSPIFRTGTVDTSSNPSSAKENDDQNEAKSSDLPNGQLDSQMANGTNGFVPLPQRNRRPRKVYYKKNPGSKIEFPPTRENGSVSA